MLRLTGLLVLMVSWLTSRWPKWDLPEHVLYLAAVVFACVSDGVCLLDHGDVIVFLLPSTEAFILD